MVPYLTACLITIVTLSISFTASAEQRRIDVMFARNVVNSEPVGVFEPGAHCDKEAGSSKVPVIDSETERKVIFFVGNWKVVVSTVDKASEVICVAHFVVG